MQISPFQADKSPDIPTTINFRGLSRAFTPLKAPSADDVGKLTFLYETLVLTGLFHSIFSTFSMPIKYLRSVSYYLESESSFS